MNYKNFIAFVVTPSENYEIFCHFGGYDKGFYGNNIDSIVGLFNMFGISSFKPKSYSWSLTSILSNVSLNFVNNKDKGILLD